MEVGHESATADAQSCVQGVKMMKLEHSEMEVSHHADLIASPLDSADDDLAPAQAGVGEELNATMNHVIDTSCYPFTAEPDDDQLNASVMIDPSNPFDDEIIERLLSKLTQPLTSHVNYHCVNTNMPKIYARGSVQLGMFSIIFC